MIPSSQYDDSIGRFTFVKNARFSPPGHVTVIVSVASVRAPSSSIQVNLSTPDSVGLNLNSKYGLAETALSRSQPKTNLPLNSQRKVLMIMRGIGLPLASLRSPVSMT